MAWQDDVRSIVEQRVSELDFEREKCRRILDSLDGDVMLLDEIPMALSGSSLARIVGSIAGFGAVFEAPAVMEQASVSSSGLYSALGKLESEGVIERGDRDPQTNRVQWQVKDHKRLLAFAASE